MKSLFLFLGMFLATGCGSRNQSSSSVKKANLVPADFSLAPIQSIDPAAPSNGNIEVTVSYWLGCGESFDHLETKSVGPISLSNPHIAIGVWVKIPDNPCDAAVQLKTVTFLEPAIAGLYTFEKM